MKAIVATTQKGFDGKYWAQEALRNLVASVPAEGVRVTRWANMIGRARNFRFDEEAGKVTCEITFEERMGPLSGEKPILSYCFDETTLLANGIMLDANAIDPGVGFEEEGHGGGERSL